MTIGGCSADSSSAPAPREDPVTAIAISGPANDGIVLRGTTVPLSADIRRGAALRPDTATLQWTSSAPAVASVSASGEVTARAAGDVVITASRDAVHATIALAVHEPVALPMSGEGPATTIAFDGALRVELATGAVPSAVSRITARRAVASPADDRLIAGSSFEFTPPDLALGAAAAVEIAYTGVPLDERADVRIVQLVDGQWVELDGSADADRATARATTTVLSRLALFRRSAPTAMQAIDGNGQVALTDDTIETPLRVRVTDAQGRAVPRVPVRFSVIAGGGRLDGETTAATDAHGVAVLAARWTLGAAPGMNQVLAATDQGASPSTVFVAVAQQRPPPVIGVSASEVALTTRSAGPDPAAQSLTVSNALPGALPLIGLGIRELAYANGDGWLEAALDHSAAPALLTLRARVGTLPEGVYRATVILASTMPDVATASVAATFTVTPGLPARLALITPPQGGVAGDLLPVQPVIEIHDGNGRRVQSSLAVTAAIPTGNPNRLTGTRTMSAVDGRVSFTDLSFNTSGTFTLRFSASGVSSVDATGISVLPRPVLQAAPSTLTFSAVLGAVSPTPSTVSLTSSTTTTIGAVSISSVSYGPGAANWLTATLNATATPTTLVVSPNSTGLAVGTYSATVALTSAYGPATIAVTMTVALPPLPPAPLNPSFAYDFSFGIDHSVWDVANYPFGRGWFRSSNARVTNGALILESPNGTYDGAELITRRRFPGGRFEADLACNAPRGAMCAFFLYETGVGDFADEIDIEILGATDQIVLTTWVGGIRTNTLTRTYPAGVDPRQLQRYTILQAGGTVTFYVGDIPLTRFTSGVPQREMELAVSLWWPTWLSGPAAYGDMTVTRVRAW